MKAKDMPCVTVEQVLRLRDHASSVEHQRDQLREALDDLLDQLAYDDEEGLFEHADVVVRARAALRATEE